MVLRPDLHLEYVALRSLILGGGNALGSYLAGAYEALHTAGEEPDWIAGTSIGAVTAGLIAGNPPERRLEQLRAYWSEAMAPDWLPWPRAAQWMGVLQTRLAGRPAMFHPRLPNLSMQPERVGIYDVAPMRRRLEELIDFDRLNSGRIRLSVVAVDLETGAEVIFDTRERRVTVDHLLASAALIPIFRPCGSMAAGWWMAEWRRTYLSIQCWDRKPPRTCFASWWTCFRSRCRPRMISREWPCGRPI